MKKEVGMGSGGLRRTKTHLPDRSLSVLLGGAAIVGEGGDRIGW